MIDDLHWVSMFEEQPQDGQQVWARITDGKPHKVTFYESPAPRWEGSSIVYEFDYFAEWAALASKQALKKSA
jgi:hypothetical protein